MLTYSRVAAYTAQVLQRLPDPNFLYVNIAGPYAFSDKDYHIAVRYGLLARFECGQGAESGDARVIREQIRELLAEDTAAEQAATPTAAEDNTIIAVDPRHFTPDDPREVVAEFYEAIANWTSSSLSDDSSEESQKFAAKHLPVVRMVFNDVPVDMESHNLRDWLEKCTWTAQ